MREFFKASLVGRQGWLLLTLKLAQGVIEVSPQKSDDRLCLCHANRTVRSVLTDDTFGIYWGLLPVPERWQSYPAFVNDFEEQALNDPVCQWIDERLAAGHRFGV